MDLKHKLQMENYLCETIVGLDSALKRRPHRRWYYFQTLKPELMIPSEFSSAKVCNE